MLKTILVASALALAAPATAQAQDTPEATAEAPAPALVRRADDVVRVLNGEMAVTEVFADSFLAQAPPERLARMIEAVRRRHGAVLGVARIEPKHAREAVIHLQFARTEIPVLLQVEGDEKARVEGLLFQGMGRDQRR